MPYRKCAVCKQVTMHFNGHCAEHSEITERPRTEVGLGHRTGSNPGFVKPYEPSKDTKPAVGVDRIKREIGEPRGVKYTADSKILEELGLHLPGANGPVRLSCELFCSFCHEPVPADKATFGKGKVVVRAKLLAKVVSTDPLEIKTEKYLTFKSDKLIACPEHSLFLLPTREKCPSCRGKMPFVEMCTLCEGTGEGTKLVTHVKFPEFD